MTQLGKNTVQEDDIIDRAKAREIVQVVLDYGINQPQMYHMIYLLSLELENPAHMRDIAALIKSFTEGNNDKKQKSSIIMEENDE